MTNRIRLTKILIFALCLVLVTASSVSVTFARYTSTATGFSAARVATWNVKAGSSASNAVSVAGDNIPFSLFDTVYDTDQPVGSGPAADNEVAPGNIAPGTKGAFELYARNDSEVSSKYTIYFDLYNPGNIPFLFSFDETAPDSQWYNSIDALNNSTAINGEKNLVDIPLDMGEENSIVIYWKWPIEQSNVEEGNRVDTQVGHNAKVYQTKITATIVADQVD